MSTDTQVEPVENARLIELLKETALEWAADSEETAELLGKAADRIAALATVQAAGAERKGIYVASRTHHAALWKEHRAKGIPIISTWIDEAGEGETADLSELWSRVQREINSAARLVLLVEAKDFPLKGAFIEVGMALAYRVPVFVVLHHDVKLEPRSMRPVGSWLNHLGVSLVPSLYVAFTSAELSGEAQRDRQFDYTRTFNAIAAAVRIEGTSIVISVKAFEKAFAKIESPEAGTAAPAEHKKPGEATAVDPGGGEALIDDGRAAPAIAVRCNSEPPQPTAPLSAPAGALDGLPTPECMIAAVADPMNNGREPCEGYRALQTRCILAHRAPARALTEAEVQAVAGLNRWQKHGGTGPFLSDVRIVLETVQRLAAPAGAKEWRQKVNDETLAIIERWSTAGALTLTLGAMENLAEQIADAAPFPAPAGAQPSEEDVARAMDALEPFSEIGKWLFASTEPDDAPAVQFTGLNNYNPVLTRGHFKAAHTALLALFQQSTKK